MHKTILKKFYSLVIGFAFLFIPEVTNAEGQETLIVGVVPQQSASRLAKIWVPFLREISDGSGQKLSFATAKDIPTFEACLAKGAYDLAYMNPYHYIVYHDVVGYQAFARQKKKRLKGIIVSRHDSDLSDLKGLEGQTLAFPSPAAFGASVVPRAEMRKQKISFTPRYVKSHDSVYRAVSAGLVPAGGGVLRTFNTVAPEIRSKLKVIYTTEGYTPHAFAAHPDVSPKIVQNIFEVMSSLQNTNQSVLKSLGMDGIEKGINADWDDVRALGLEHSQTNIITRGDEKCHSG
ncbi:phosphate/phosphite/phosphonate ABC transporter substrate-binding protein [Kiloniella majae]|uniref:phosphate/phosphite/phosphonate ABC transporter substrate-binding protein n=1 Tax=Kiloniella majae TaxID=1938558 RepID=UPI000A278EC2|nr:phosphate/phosphite/phosphonate ABC transporter substrate-binding protein [Kiloniella majae]